MKNMKKLLQRAMVFTLTAAMLVGTPMTASAAGLADVYTIQKPGVTDDPDPTVNTTGTGTVTNTETGSSALTENESRIRGIVLDKDTVEAEKGIEETLTAEIVLDQNSADANDAVNPDELKKLNNKIVWKIGRLDNGKFVQDTEMSKILGMKVDTAEENWNRNKVTLIPKQGTAAGKEVYIQASINGSYYLEKDEATGKYSTYEYAEDMGELTALAKVSVKEYTESLAWTWGGDATKAPKAYKDHKIDLNKYLVRDPATANDTITWAVAPKEKNAVTISDTGVLTVKKAGVGFTAYAMGERCPRLAWTVEATEAGVQATAVELWSLKTDGTWNEKITKAVPVDVGGTANEDNEDKEIKVKAKLFVSKSVVVKADGNPATTQDDAEAGKKNNKYSVKNIKLTEGDQFIEANKTKDGLVTPAGSDSVVQTLVVTDDVTWEIPVKQAGIASVVADPANDRLATIKVSKDATPGTANITAKTPKKSAKMSVKVSATLIDLEITNDETELYSGQTLQMSYKRNPAGNKDSVKWSIEKVGGKANPNATINGKGLLTIKPTVTDGAKVTVVLTSPKKGTRGEKTASKDIIVKQSSIDGITVTEVNPRENYRIAEVGLDNKGRVVQKVRVTKDTPTQLDIPVNARYEIDVVQGANTAEGFTKDIAKNTLTYKTSSKKVAEITNSSNGKLTITPKAPGTATITVSGIRATANKGKVTGKAISTTFKVTVSQPVTNISLSKSNIVLAENQKSGQYKDLKISGLKVTFGPKAANKKAEKAIRSWEYRKWTGEGWTTWATIKNNKGNVTSASLSYTLKAPKAGDVYEVRVTSATGLQKTATVTVVSPTTELTIASGAIVKPEDPPMTYAEGNKKNTKYIELGKSIDYIPYVNIGTRNDPKWYAVGTDGEGFLADTIASCTVNKKGIVSINPQTGKIRALKEGKVTITFKTNTNKSAKLNIKVTVTAPEGGSTK